MTMTLSPPVKILALIGLLAVVALGASTMLLGKSSSPVRTSTAQPHNTATVAPHVTPKTAAHAAAKTHVAAKAHAKTTAPAKKAVHKAVATPAKAHAATKAHAVAKHAATPVRHGNLVYADLPSVLQKQLALHKVVVVSLYNPNADVDAISVAEAHAGATDAASGFLLVNVLDNSIAGPLTALLPGGGLLPDPGVLVYRAPGDIMVRFNGFVDRATVSQAVTNALAAPPSVPQASTAAPAATTPAPAGTTGAP